MPCTRQGGVRREHTTSISNDEAAHGAKLLTGPSADHGYQSIEPALPAHDLTPLVRPRDVNIFSICKRISTVFPLLVSPRSRGRPQKKKRPGAYPYLAKLSTTQLDTTQQRLLHLGIGIRATLSEGAGVGGGICFFWDIQACRGALK
jgi:hypothetical protein